MLYLCLSGSMFLAQRRQTLCIFVNVQNESTHSCPSCQWQEAASEHGACGAG